MDNRSERAAFAVFEDSQLDKGKSVIDYVVCSGLRDYGGVGVRGGGDVGVSGYGDDYGGNGGSVSGNGGSVSNGGVSGNGVSGNGGGDVGGGDVGVAHKPLREERMFEGMALIQVTGNYGYKVTKVGWLHRIEGDEWVIRGAIVIKRTGNLVDLEVLASEGLGVQHTATAPATTGERLHRWSASRCLEVNEAAWIAICPKA
jgi:hypothetical protein